jgi:ATP-dependent Clp protease ATP-binding subunit ClpB
VAFQFEKLTVKAQESVQRAQQIAQERKNLQLAPLHLLQALLQEADGVVKPLMQKMGIQVAQLQGIVTGEVERLPQSSSDDVQLSMAPNLSKVFDAAAARATQMGDEYVSTEHLLFALTTVEDAAQRILKMHAVAEADVLKALKTVRGGQKVVDQHPEDKYQSLENTARTWWNSPEKTRSIP